MMDRRFYANLECLRGVAALMVAVAHSYIAITFDGVDRLWQVPLTSIASRDALIASLILFWANGKAAVTLFFILSGVVLGLSLDNHQGGAVRKYGNFLLKRLFRIYPAHLFILTLLVVLIKLFSIVNPGSFVHASEWYNWYYRTPPDPQVVLENIFLLDASLNPVTWTLQVETGVALIFPILYYLSRRGNGLGWAQGLVLVLLVAAAFFFDQGSFAPHVYKFFLGLLVPSIIAFGVRRSWHLSRSSAGAALILSLALLLGPPQYEPHAAMNGVIQSLGALAVVIIFMIRTAGGLCRLHLSKRLGQYSYSFYLIHFPLLWLAYYCLNQYALPRVWLREYSLFSASVVGVLTVVVAYVCSAGCYWLIEKRFILWGRRLAEAVFGSRTGRRGVARSGAR